MSSKVSNLTELTTPDNADLLLVSDISATTSKKVTWANILATAKTYFDTLYQAVLVSGTNIKTVNSNSLLGSGNVSVGDVTKVATPVDNQVGVWTGDGTIEGDAALTFDTTTDTLTVGAGAGIVVTHSTKADGSDGLLIEANNGTDVGLLGAANTANVTWYGTHNFPATGFQVGSSSPFSDSTGTLTLQNVDVLDATTESTIESAIDTLANLTSIQGRTITLADAGADAILGWDDSADAYENLTQAEVLAIIGDSSETAKGVSELSTSAEIITGTDNTRVITPAGFTASFRGIPQNSQSTAYTTVLSDSGKHILHPSADTTARTFTIDSNANVPYPIGTAITFINQNSAGTVTISITSDTMRLAGAGTTGSRTLASNGIATAIKITSTEWIISGTGLT